MKYKSFESTYSYEFLSNIDCDLHHKMLDKYFEIFGDITIGDLVFFDIGCNAGSFLKATSNYSKLIEFHCFEPHPELYDFLSKSYSKYRINNMCVSDYDGFCIINIPSISVGISSIIDRDVFDKLKEDQEIYRLDVECTTIDSYCLKNNIEQIDYIKIDVEGAEYMVLCGCMEMLSNGKIKAGQFEVGIEKEIGISIDKIVSLLNEYGYIVCTELETDYFFYKKQ